MLTTLLRAATTVLLFIMTVLVLMPAQALASHVRHADISWRVPNPSTAPRTVEFVVNFTWTGAYSETFQTGDGARYTVGNGAPNSTLVASGTDASGSPYRTYRTVVTHTYASTTAYTAFIQSGARIGNLNNGANGSYRMASEVDLRSGTSAAPNTAGPQTASNALISLQAGTQAEYLFPMTDPDGDPVTCRIQTQEESLIAGPSFGGTSPVIDTFNGACRVRWDLRNASTNTTLHSLPIRMESIHGGLVSSSVIDIIVLTSNIAPPVCTGNAALTVGVGQTASATVTGTHGSNGSGNLRMDAFGAPPGSVITPSSGTSRPAPYSASISWTPGPSDSGTTRLILMTYTNSSNSSSSCTVSVFTRPECGNGVIETGESCDDGNTANDDECTSECRFRPVALDDAFVTPEDTRIIVDVKLNDPTAAERDVDVVIHHETHHGTMQLLPDGRVEYTPGPNFHGVDDFGYMLSDGVAMSDHTTVEITVTPVNDPPVAIADAFETPEDTPVEFRIFATDVDGGEVYFDMLTSTEHGTLSGTAPVLTYTPNGDFNGTDSFTFRANDGTLTSPPVEVTIDVTPVNDPPAATAQSTTLAEDTSTTITLAGSDLDGDSLTFAVAGQPAHGTLSGTPPALVYTPDANFNGSDSFTYQSSDGALVSQAATVNLTVTPVNDAPVAANGSATAPEDGDTTLTLTASDVDQDTLTYSIAVGPQNGMLSGTAPNLTYTPFTDFEGTDRFTFTVSDGELGSNTATFDLTVTPINDPPVADAGAETLDEDTSQDLTLLGSDIDGDALTFTVVSAPSNGTLSGDAPNLTYTPDPDFNGTDTFTFRTNDGSTASQSATFVLTVDPVNDAPVASDDSLTADEDGTASVVLQASDVEGDALTFSVQNGPSNGVLSGTAPNLVYTPNANFNGADSFTFTATDDELVSNTATIDISVNPLNDAPLADAGAVTLDEDTSQSLALQGSDIDGDALTFMVVSAPSNGTLSGDAPNLTYTPDPDFNGTDSFTFRANDSVADSEPATFVLTVVPVNDAPVAVDDSLSVDEDGTVSFTLQASDVEGDALDYSIQTGPVNGTLSGTAPNLVYSPNADFNGSDSFTFSATDGELVSNTATVDITVETLNDAPTAQTQQVTVQEDDSVEIVLTGADIDGDEIGFEVVDEPAFGMLSGTAPNVVYTPDGDFNGEDSFTFRTTDGDLFSSTVAVDITVTPVNDAPVAFDDEVETLEDESIEVTLSGADIDSDGLSFTIVDAPLYGVLTGDAPDVTYVPNADFNGEDTFTFSMNDGELDSELATVSLTVTPVNDAPLVDDLDSLSLDDPESADVTVFVSDIDDADDDLVVEVTSSDDSIIDASQVLVSEEGGERTLTVFSNGNVGMATLTVTVTDPDGLSSSTTFDVEVSCVDDLDADGVCDGSDVDLDGDGVDNDDDNCADLVNPDQDDLDNDGLGDDCDLDIDGDGLTNTEEDGLGTDPLVSDTDGDGCRDGQEVNDGSDPLNGLDCDEGLLLDTDEDGLTDYEESTIYLTDPELADTDADGLTDGEEVLDHGTDPLDEDTDADGLSDSEEIDGYLTDPLVDDTDGDGCIDGGEVNDGTDPLNPIDCDQGLLVDTDADGVTDYEEITVYGTDPLLADSDDDGLLDGEELLTYDTDPLDPDSDGDACTDGEEVDGGTDPLWEIDCGDGLLIDSDGDGVSDFDEIDEHGTDPLFDDTDGDGITDGDELDQNTDPLDPEDGPEYYVAGGCDCQVSSAAPAGGVMVLPLLLLWAGRRRRQAA